MFCTVTDQIRKMYGGTLVWKSLPENWHEICKSNRIDCAHIPPFIQESPPEAPVSMKLPSDTYFWYDDGVATVALCLIPVPVSKNQFPVERFSLVEGKVVKKQTTIITIT